jgi:formamidopyrimidine-DNA glycosylase
MPELPEVETFVRILRDGQEGQSSILGSRIESADVLWHKTLATPSPEDFVKRIKQQMITSITRRGKFVVIGLNQDYLLIHLRMSGDLVVKSAGNGDEPKHVRLTIRFEDGRSLLFNDPRKFGRVWLVNDPLDVVGGLGLEPLDLTLTTQIFHSMLAERNRFLKPLLLDQTFLAGVGNIYSDEALHLAKVHPLRRSASLTEGEAAGLLTALQTVLQEGIRRNGSSIDWVYRGGDFQNHFRVYGRTDEPCPVCGTRITHLTVGQRSTHICEKCQPLED